MRLPYNSGNRAEQLVVLFDGIRREHALRFFGVVLGRPGVRSLYLAKKYFLRERLTPGKERPRQQDEQNGFGIEAATGDELDGIAGAKFIRQEKTAL